MKKISTFWLNYLRPNIFVRDISKINLRNLKSRGIKLIVCDLDNTLVPHFSKYPNKFTFDFLEKVKSEGIDIIIASNNTKKRVLRFYDKLQDQANVKTCIWSSKKPFSKKIKKYIKDNNYKFNDVVFIGDQFITDIFLANRLKASSILVLPLVDQSKTISINIFFRFIERFIYKKLTHENVLNQNNLYIETMDEEYELL